MIIEKVRKALPGYSCNVSFPEEGKLMVEVRVPVLGEDDQPMNAVTRCGGPLDSLDEILDKVSAVLERTHGGVVLH